MLHCTLAAHAAHRQQLPQAAPPPPKPPKAQTSWRSARLVGCGHQVLRRLIGVDEQLRGDVAGVDQVCCPVHCIVALLLPVVGQLPATCCGGAQRVTPLCHLLVDVAVTQAQDAGGHVVCLVQVLCVWAGVCRQGVVWGRGWGWGCRPAMTTIDRHAVPPPTGLGGGGGSGLTVAWCCQSRMPHVRMPHVP